MNILYVSPSHGAGYGQERVVETQIKGLILKGHHVRVLTQNLMGELSPDVRIVPNLFKNFSVLSGHDRTVVLDQITNEIKSFLPDVIHLVDLVHPTIMTAFKNCPVFYTAHTVAPTCPAATRVLPPNGICNQPSGLRCLSTHLKTNCMQGMFKNKLSAYHAWYVAMQKKRTLASCHKIIAVSRYIYKLLLQDGLSENKVCLLYNPVDVDATLMKKAEKDSKTTLAFVGRFTHVKDPLAFLRLIEKLPGVMGYLYGTGPLEADLKKYRDEHNLAERIKFRGHLDREEFFKEITQRDLLVVTNQGPESFGMAAAEAQALGVCVVGYRVPGISEVVEHGKTGWLVEAGNFDNLVKSVEQLVRDKQYRTLMGHAGRLRMQENFSAEAHIAGLLDLYHS